jgi:hypothetical protein
MVCAGGFDWSIEICCQKMVDSNGEGLSREGQVITSCDGFFVQHFDSILFTVNTFCCFRKQIKKSIRMCRSVTSLILNPYGALFFETQRF